MHNEFRDTLKKSQAIRGMVNDFRRVYYSSFARHESAIEEYFSTCESPRLHLGAGSDCMEGWLNTDIVPANARVAFLDMTKPFPFEDETFDFIYSEHCIEHVPHKDGALMLEECRRVLKPGGVLRIATPDLTFLMGLIGTSDQSSRDYVEWIANLTGVEPTAISVLNNAFRAWGHQFLYDARTLENSLKGAGFRHVSRERYNASQHEALRNVEKHGVNVGNEAMVILETMVFEATK
jgi:predicted SAM-dependent methyltransferase